MLTVTELCSDSRTHAMGMLNARLSNPAAMGTKIEHISFLTTAMATDLHLKHMYMQGRGFPQ